LQLSSERHGITHGYVSQPALYNSCYRISEPEDESTVIANRLERKFRPYEVN